MAVKCGMCCKNCKAEEGVICTKKCEDASVENKFIEKLKPLEKQIENLSSLIKDDIISQLNCIKLDVQKSLDHNNLFESKTKEKFVSIEAEYNNIRKQLNRGDILVHGLPAYISNEGLYSTAESIAKICNVSLVESDLNFCLWISKKSCVLLKFNSIRKRDAIMKSYRSTYNLKLCQILSTDIASRVFLSDHYTPSAEKLRYMCRRKIKSGEIKKFRLQNRDIPIAFVVLNDGKEIKMTLEDINQHFLVEVNSHVGMKDTGNIV